MEEITKETLEKLLKDGSVRIVYPAENSEKAATALSDMLEESIGIIKWTDDELNEEFFGVLVKKNENDSEMSN